LAPVNNCWGALRCIVEEACFPVQHFAKAKHTDLVMKRR
jgi:hypothetical protein